MPTGGETCMVPHCLLFVCWKVTQPKQAVRCYTTIIAHVGFPWLFFISSYRLGTNTKIFTINPKDRSVNELYGLLDPSSRDWTDGLLSSIFREINRPLPPNKKELRYILFDGDVDALWVENMNSVMDDNRLMTLANGERIRLQKHCALLFEVRV